MAASAQRLYWPKAASSASSAWGAMINRRCSAKSGLRMACRRTAPPGDRSAAQLQVRPQGLALTGQVEVSAARLTPRSKSWRSAAEAAHKDRASAPARWRAPATRASGCRIPLQSPLDAAVVHPRYAQEYSGSPRESHSDNRHRAHRTGGRQTRPRERSSPAPTAAAATRQASRLLSASSKQSQQQGHALVAAMAFEQDLLLAIGTRHGGVRALTSGLVDRRHDCTSDPCTPDRRDQRNSATAYPAPGPPPRHPAY